MRKLQATRNVDFRKTFAGRVGLMTYRTWTLGRLALAVSLGLAASAACGGGSEMTTDATAGAAGSGGTPPIATGGTTSSTGGTTAEAGSSSGGNGTAGEGGGAPEEPLPGDGVAVCEEDEECQALGQVCAGFRRVCVDCVNSGDCEDDEVCAHGACEARPTCEDSLDCPSTDLVCVPRGGGEPGPDPGPQQGLCLECESGADCEEDESCVDNACVRGCDSDKDCTPLGLLCDFDTGSCVDCLDSSGCADGEYCSDGTCLEAICTPGESVCLGNGVSTCNEVGSGYGEADTCFGGTCEASDGEATCVPD